MEYDGAVRLRTSSGSSTGGSLLFLAIAALAVYGMFFRFLDPSEGQNLAAVASLDATTSAARIAASTASTTPAIVIRVRSDVPERTIARIIILAGGNIVRHIQGTPVYLVSVPGNLDVGSSIARFAAIPEVLEAKPNVVSNPR